MFAPHAHTERNKLFHCVTISSIQKKNMTIEPIYLININKIAISNLLHLFFAIFFHHLK